MDPTQGGDPLHGAETLLDVLDHWADETPDRVAVTYEPDGESVADTLTYGQLRARARAAAGHLQRSIAPGEPVLVLCPPGTEYVLSVFTCLYAGAVAVPGHVPRRSRFVARASALAADSGATMALTSADSRGAAERAAGSDAVLGRVRYLVPEEVSPEEAERWRRPELSREDTAVLQYTSGSTLDPRGVMLSHANLLHNSHWIRRRFGHDSDLRGVVWLPPYHDMGLIGGILQPLYVGGRTHLLSPWSVMKSPVRWLRAIDKHRAMTSGGPNFMYDACVKHIAEEERERLDLSSWRVAFCGAEPIRPETLRGFAEAFAPSDFDADALFPCYGLAEATLLASGGSASRGVVYHATGGREHVGCGRALDDQQVAVVDPESGRPVASGEVGEVWIRGPSVAAGYWARPEHSEQTFGARLATGEGPFLRTGDLGFLDDEELFIAGRIKDLVIIDGENHYPQDVERTVETCHPALAAAGGAAFSVDSGRERLVLVHEVVRGWNATEAEDVYRAVRRAVAEEHGLRVAAIALLRPAALPRTTSGKVRRHEARARYLDGTLREVARWAGLEDAHDEAPPPAVESLDDLEAWLVARVAALARCAPEEIRSDVPLASYGLDSAAATQVAGELEATLGQPVPATLAYEYPTIEAIVGHLTADNGTQGEPTPSRAAAPEHASFAIVGMACRFPGAPDVRSYWSLLSEGRDAVTEVPASRWSSRALDEVLPPIPHSRWGGFLDQVDLFDPEFFGISLQEAAQVDPQQRLLLELTWEALEDAGHSPDGLAGRRVGVFMGVSTNDYGRIPIPPRQIDGFWATGNAISIAANRISYAFDFRGPSIAVDTACSSSLVAMHLACESLRRGEATAAIVGGANVILSPQISISFASVGAMAPDGRCKAFDAAADGMVRSEGAGVVVIKRLEQALADGDSIYAVVLGSAVGQDGRSNGLAAPRGPAQEEVLRDAYRAAGVAPSSVQLVEAHGTGTRLGDPIEAAALGAVLGHDRPPERPCTVGSVKSNLGHLEAAAGIASLMKVALSIRKRAIPASLHFDKPNPDIPFEELKLRVSRSLEPWPAEGVRRVAGVSSFGFGGTNAHLVLAEPPEPSRPGPEPADAARRADRSDEATLLPLSARSKSALHDLARSYQELVESEGAPSLPDLAYSATRHRAHHDHRAAVAFLTREELVEGLRACALDRRPVGVAVGRRAARGRVRPVFVFSGMGGEWAGMGRALSRTEPVFRGAIEECDAYLGRPVLTFEEPPEGATELEWTQTAVFAIQVALSRLWSHWGIVPRAVVGHSMGEIAAACVAGALTLPDALSLVEGRSRLLGEALSADSRTGAMAAIRLSVGDVREALAANAGEGVWIAAHNAPELTVVSGERSSVQSFLATLRDRRVASRLIPVPGPGHSPEIGPLSEKLALSLADLEPSAGTLPFYSSVTGGHLETRELGAAYWAMNLSEPILFAEAVAAVLRESGEAHAFVELSPSPLLTGSLNQCVRGHPGQLVLASLRRDEDERASMLRGVASLYAHGADIDWAALVPDGERVDLPRYPWQRQRCWIEADGGLSRQHNWVEGTRGRGPLGGVRLPDAPGSGAACWQLELDGSCLPLVGGLGQTVSGCALLEMAVSAGIDFFGRDAVLLHRVEACTDLTLPGQEARVVRVTMLPAPNDEATFSIDSRGATDDAGPWTLHARGYAAVDGTPTTDRAAEERPPADRGVRPGEACVPVQGESTGDGWTSGVSPAVLDEALRALGRADDSAGAGHGYAFVGLDRACFRGLPSSRLWSHARVREGVAHGTLTGDVKLLDDEGAVVAELDSVRLRGPSSPLTDGVMRGWVDRVSWEEVAHRTETGGGDGPRLWLLFADRAGVGRAVKKLLEARGEECVLVTAGSYRRGGPRSFRLSPDREGDYLRLFDELEGLDADASLSVIHLWNLDVTSRSIARATNLACMSVLHLVQRLAHAGCRSTLWIATRGAQPVGGDECAVSPLQAPAWGFGRSVAEEHRALWGGVIDLDPHASVGESAEALVEELFSPDGEDQLAFRDGKRYAARLVPRDTPPTAPPRLRSDATYLITGGLGALGLVTARWMVERGARWLILLARTRLPTRGSWNRQEVRDAHGDRIEAIRALEAMGAHVRPAAVDVGDRDALRSFLKRYRREGRPPIRGVMHLAGSVSAAPLQDLDAAHLRADLRPKVDGTWHLDRLLADDPLDFFVMFSSGASILGSPLLAGYAAANSFLDVMAHDRRSRGLPALSINWGFWTEVGMAAREIAQYGRTYAPRGMKGFTNLQGTEMLDRLFGAAEPQLAVLPFDWDEWKRYHPLTATRPLLRTVLGAADDQAVAAPGGSGLSRTAIRNEPQETRAALVERYLAEQLAQALDVEPSELDHHQALDTVGLDSLMALELKNRIERDLDIVLSVTRLLVGPTIAQFGEHILELVREPATPVSAAPADGDDGPAASRISAAEAARLEEQVDTLSDEEVDAILKTLLAEDTSGD